MRRLCAIWATITLVSLLQRNAALHAQDGGTSWEPPVVVFDAGQAAEVFNPLVIEDTQGRIKILWETVVAPTGSDDLVDGIYCIDGDGRYWSAPIDVIVAPDGGRTFWPQHALDAYGRLHLVWVGPNATLHHSYAPSAEACNARSWQTAPLPISLQVLHASIEVDDQGVLHVAFAVPDNNVYYTRSSDDGNSWTNPVAVSAVVPATAASYPGIAIDAFGRVYVAWEEAQLPDGVPSLGLFFAISEDGQRWSASSRLSQPEGEYTQPTVIALPGDTVHFLWDGRISTRGRYHQWTADGGLTWSPISEFIPKSMGGGQTGPPGAATDSAGTLHVATGTDDTTHAAWTGQSWTSPQDIAAFDAFGNMEHQNISVAKGRELYVVANARLQQIVLIRGFADAPEALTAFQQLPPDQASAQLSPTPVPPTEPAIAASPTAPRPALDTAQPAPPDNLFSAISLSAGAALLVVAAVSALILRWRR